MNARSTMPNLDEPLTISCSHTCSLQMSSNERKRERSAAWVKSLGVRKVAKMMLLCVGSPGRRLCVPSL